MATQKVNIDIQTKGAKKSKDELSGLTGAISKVGKAAGIASAAYFGAKGLIAGFQRTINLSATHDVVSRGFDNLAKSSNFSSQAFQKFQRATDGTVSSIELMTQANNAMLLGITDSEDQMAEMFDIAQRLASALGKDTAFGIESLVTGLGRQSKLMLDNLGIMVDTVKANKDFAQSLGKTVEQLTDQEKKQAFVNASLESARELVNSLGEEQLTTKDTVAILSASFDDLGIAIGNKLSPLVKFLAKDFITLTESVTEFIGPEVISREEQLASLLDQRSRLLGQVTEKTNEAVLVEDLFTESALEQGRVQKDTIDFGLEALDAQILKFSDLLSAQEQDLEIKRATHDLSIESIDTNDLVAQSIDKIGNKTTKTSNAFESLNENLDKAIASSIASASSFTSTTNALLAAEKAAKQAAISFVSGEIQKAVANYIFKYLATSPLPPIISGPLAVAAGAAFGSVMSSAIARNFATGGDFITSGPEMIMVGDNPGGRERVQVTPLSSPNINGPQGSITLNISAPLVDETVVESIIPAIEKAQRQNLA